MRHTRILFATALALLFGGCSDPTAPRTDVPERAVFDGGNTMGSGTMLTDSTSTITTTSDSDSTTTEERGHNTMGSGT